MPEAKTDNKPKKRSFVRKIVIMVLLLGTMIFGGLLGAYSKTSGFPSTGDDWKAFGRYAMGKAEEAKTKASEYKEKLASIDWSSIDFNLLTDKTKGLYEKAAEDLSKDPQPQRSPSPSTSEPAPTGGDSTAPVATVPPVTLDEGYIYSVKQAHDAMREGQKFYMDSLPKKGKLKEAARNLKKAKTAFENAQDYLNEAAKSRGGSLEKYDEDLMKSIQQFLYDCQKRSTI